MLIADVPKGTAHRRATVLFARWNRGQEIPPKRKTKNLRLLVSTCVNPFCLKTILGYTVLERHAIQYV